MPFKKALASLLLFFSLSPFAFAFEIPEPDGFVTDLTGVFSADEERLIEDRIRLIEDNTTAEVGVLMLSTTEDQDISQLAFDVGNTWGVGKKENDNGLMILVAIEDRNWFMATGYGLEGALPDAITKRIAENHFPYYFRDSLYKDGIMAALNDIELFLQEDPSIIAEYSEETAELEDPVGFAKVFTILLVIAFLKSFFVGFSKSKIKMSLILNVILFFVALILTTLSYAGAVLAFSLFIDLITLVASSGAGGGGSGGSSYRSSSSTSSSSSSYGSSSYSSGSSSSGSDDSFGGGSFGGGGSGGSW